MNLPVKTTAQVAKETKIPAQRLQAYALDFGLGKMVNAYMWTDADIERAIEKYTNSSAITGKASSKFNTPIARHKTDIEATIEAQRKRPLWQSGKLPNSYDPRIALPHQEGRNIAKFATGRAPLGVMR